MVKVIIRQMADSKFKVKPLPPTQESNFEIRPKHQHVLQDILSYNHNIFVTSVINASKHSPWATFKIGNINTAPQILVTTSLLTKPCKVLLKPCKTSSMLILHLPLLQSGNLKPNPGPKQVNKAGKSKEAIPQFSCLLCKGKVSWSKDALQCGTCDQWLHQECINMNDGSYKIPEEASSFCLCCK